MQSRRRLRIGARFKNSLRPWSGIIGHLEGPTIGSSFELELSLSNSAQRADRQLCCRLELSKTCSSKGAPLPRRMLPIIPLDGIYRTPTLGSFFEFQGLFRTRTEFLTAVERDYRTSRKGQPLGPLSNSNCFFRTRTISFELGA